MIERSGSMFSLSWTDRFAKKVEPKSKLLCQMSEREVRAKANWLKRHGHEDEAESLIEDFSNLKKAGK